MGHHLCSEASAEVSTARFANRRVEHGPFPHTEFGFPKNQARGRCNGVETVLSAVIPSGWLDHGWGALAFPGALQVPVWLYKKQSWQSPSRNALRGGGHRDSVLPRLSSFCGRGERVRNTRSYRGLNRSDNQTLPLSQSATVPAEGDLACFNRGSVSVGTNRSSSWASGYDARWKAVTDKHSFVTSTWITTLGWNGPKILRSLEVFPVLA